jgi:two-component system sensor histidine kinase PilS (NtrC family)
MKILSYPAETKVASVLIFRIAIFVILLVSSFLFLPLSSFFLSCFAVYGVVTLAFLLSLFFSGHRLVQQWFGQISVCQLFLEILLEALLVQHSGGIRSPLSALFFLTIVSASFSHQLIGTILVASWASLLYSGMALFAAGWNFSSLFSLEAIKGLYNLSDEHFYTLFIYLCSFYLTAFSSGYLAQRLKIKAELLLTASRQLRRVRMETDDILEHLHSGLITIDNSGRIVYFNRAAEEILQYQSREVKGKDFRSVFRERMPELMRDLLTGLESNQTEARKELEITDQQGRKIPLGMSTSLLQDEEGKVAGVIALFQDLTHIKHLQEQLRTKDRLAAIGELSAGIAHEIRNPLASISGSVEVLKQELHLEGDNWNLMELIIKETQRLNQILTEFLSFARIGSIQLNNVDLVPLIEEVIDIVRQHSCWRPEIKIENQFPLHSVLVQGEDNQIKQLLLNLLINAAEAMEGKNGRILISNQALIKSYASGEEPVDKWVSVSIADQGKGMTSEQLAKMYLPFYSTKKQGTGLGLSIVQRLVDSLGGKIECQSQIGEGTVFVVFLQKSATQAAPAEPVLSSDPVNSLISKDLTTTK